VKKGWGFTFDTMKYKRDLPLCQFRGDFYMLYVFTETSDFRIQALLGFSKTAKVSLLFLEVRCTDSLPRVQPATIIKDFQISSGDLALPSSDPGTFWR
jgi:hypothetical protein